MIFEFKLCPLNRQTSKRVVEPEAAEPCFEVNAQVLMEILKPLGKDDGAPFVMSIFAQVLGEMIGADVFYRPKNFDTWRMEKGFLPRAAEYVARREVVTHAKTISAVLEQVDSRCQAVDGPVSPTKDEIRSDEFRKLYVAAQSIIKACAEVKNGNH